MNDHIEALCRGDWDALNGAGSWDDTPESVRILVRRHRRAGVLALAASVREKSVSSEVAQAVRAINIHAPLSEAIAAALEAIAEGQDDG